MSLYRGLYCLSCVIGAARWYHKLVGVCHSRGDIHECLSAAPFFASYGKNLSGLEGWSSAPTVCTSKNPVASGKGRGEKISVSTAWNKPYLQKKQFLPPLCTGMGSLRAAAPLLFCTASTLLMGPQIKERKEGLRVRALVILEKGIGSPCHFTSAILV